MSKFYGTVVGSANTVATRRGFDYIKAAAQSWDGSLATSLWYNRDGELMVQLNYNESSSTTGECVFSGTMAELLKKLGKEGA